MAEKSENKNDKGGVPADMIIKFSGFALKAIPGVSQQGEKGMRKMLKGVIMLADDVSDKVDAALDIDG